VSGVSRGIIIIRGSSERSARCIHRVGNGIEPRLGQFAILQ
jgi:hypothetical protein